ncbi:uncharacterized protein G2W53_039540 [Senna tora]|uniref:Uncharacterized protein n=1 Tax=Senna tora TaxID=362788 RepID=A0A834W815_9FABA|nr:uncharacterized protein G2W53_039540 [Senna tora]
MRRLGMKGAWFGEVEGIGDEAILETAAVATATGIRMLFFFKSISSSPFTNVHCFQLEIFSRRGGGLSRLYKFNIFRLPVTSIVSRIQRVSAYILDF